MIIGIIGYGRFGKLLHEKLKSEHEFLIFQKDSSLENLKKCEVIFLCVPINALEIVVKKIKNNISGKAIIVDVCSVKIKPAKILKKILKKNILATHPLFGPDSAAKGFNGHKMVFCPLNIRNKDFQKVKNIFTKRGVKAIITTPQKHDQMMARSQALVHFIGRSLPDLKAQEISTPDYQNLLSMMGKVKNDTWELFFDMQNLNPYAAKERKKIIKNILAVEKKINLYQQDK